MPSLRSPRRPRLAAVLAAAALLVGSLAAAQTGTFAQNGEPDDDGSGPVDTSSGAFDLLQSQLDDLLGRDILEKTTKILSGGKEYSLTNNLDTSLIPTDLLRELGLGDALVKLGLGGKDSGGTVPDDGVRREYLVVWAGDNNVLDRTGSDLTSLPAEIHPEPDRPEGPDRPRLLRRGRRDQGLLDVRPGREHRDRRPARGERAAPHAVRVAQGPQHLRRRPVHRRHLRHRHLRAAQADAQVHQHAHRHDVRVGPGRVLGDRERQGLRHLHGRPGRARTLPVQRRVGPARQRLRRLARRGRAPRRERQDAVGGPGDAGEGRDRAAVRQHPAAQRTDLRQPARHPGPRGPRDDGDQRLQRAAQHHPQPGAPAVVVPPAADGPHLGHLRPGQAEAEGGLVPAGRSA